ncbi:MAG TPA: fused MFS/spermidine synthase, partial [Vicinamibacterales bacterium]|nr:fused MFS/spermidine synthase [Vicinamibacterales bacterium]
MPRAPLPLAAVLLCCSGAAAIIYQLVWLRRLGLVFGVTVHAATAVLAAFMAGLALGSLAAGRLADRVRAPFGWFGGVEILIGVSALATPVLLTLLHDLSPVMHAWADDRPAVLTALRFGGSLAVLLVPTTLMGATLPFALRSVIASAEPTGRVAAVLYATNTAGALAGALAAGYLLIARIGLTPSLRIAALLNL